jgi:ATP-dependent DNA helicase Q1
VAEGLEEMSQQKIKTGVYHEGIEAEEKQVTYEGWLQGSIRVMCATAGE